ncbi:ABC transporter ATP-binding protein [Eubacterium oxidoreducens]|uniref:ABC-type multidrug transport system, ATPase component n=1 Tax=Eubacterium oxidoreducens TaxID=1732 RepID=A0A1G6ACJ2_EUBOX|nr:ATP-binding cassette domain-containing protein [Eubacterium oxidoreducens]SDB05763.1 ABC-type multidrug transport system, ATPase component [Eubacterium oxidoreducens]
MNKVELKMNQVVVSFRKDRALNGITLTMEPGIYGLIGENGAGKTTLFRSTLEVQSYKGVITKNGISSIGYVPQHFDCLKRLTVGETMKYFCSLKNISHSQRREDIERVLTIVNLTEERDKLIKNLSGGMLRRVGIAQALLGEPQLLIMDEPTVGLDPAERVNFRNIIKKIKGDRIVWISSHEIGELEQMCDRFMLMKQGSLVCMGDLETLYQEYETDNIETLYFKAMGKEIC